MGYAAYSELKETGVPWLGPVPAHWRPKRLRFALQTNPSANAIRLESDALVSFVPMDAVGEYGGIRADIDKELGDIGGGYTYFADGDVVVAKITPCFENGKGALAEGLTNGIAFGTTELHVLRAGQELDKRFLFYLTISHPFRALGEAEMYGAGGQKRVPDNFIKDFHPALPPLSEQQAIVRFLDHKTAEIDALIAKKEALLQKLAEKRTALISHAVTKGLDPEVPMKDSGITWLQEVPRHWIVKRLKTISPFITVGIVVNPSEYISDEGLPFIYGGDISEGKISVDSARRISTEASDSQPKTKLNAGDLLTVRVGAPGVTAVVPDVCAGGNCASVMLTRQGNFNSKWLCYAMNSRMVRYQVELVQYGAAQEQFNISHAINFWVATPPMKEQEAISSFLDSETTRLDLLASRIAGAIVHLNEYRSALITAAVTGKIDVREFKPSQGDSHAAAALR